MTPRDLWPWGRDDFFLALSMYTRWNKFDQMQIIYWFFACKVQWPLVTSSWNFDPKVTIDFFPSYQCTPEDSVICFYFLLLKIWSYLTFDPFMLGRTTGSPLTLLHVYPCPTYWHWYFCYLKKFWNFDLFDLWPINGTSFDGVTVGAFVFLSMLNTLALLFLPIEIFNFFKTNLTFWPP